MSLEDDMPSDWKELMQNEFSKPYWSVLNNEVKRAYNTKVIYPPRCDLFKALHLCPLEKTIGCILGQDPYIHDREAHGLAFSVNQGIKMPPSLRNIYREISTDLKDDTIIPHENLEQWAQQGILLWNTCLTVEANKSASHQHLPWNLFTAALLARLSEWKDSRHKPIFFLLWGNHAQNQSKFIQGSSFHLILKAAHPSPLSAHRGFFGCGHFRQVQEFLAKNQYPLVHW